MSEITYEQFVSHTRRGRPSIYQPFLEQLVPGQPPVAIPIPEGTDPASAVTGLRNNARKMNITDLSVKKIDGVYMATRILPDND